MADAQKQQTWTPGKKLTGAALTAFTAATVALVAPVLTEPNEGYSGPVYKDPAGYLTQCYGERQVDPSVIYSKSACATKLRARMAKDYGPAIVKCVPDFTAPAHQLAYGASIDVSYNAGPAAFCRSPMAKAFNAGRWTAGCKAFPGWYVTSRGVRYPGLVRRRGEEQSFCLTGKQR
ncbi:glycoside hydrolase family protein [Novosphingobium sp. 9]|uniref:glycoside hydrolase family protein n=1 Tax=Novosphingobium sp. 9 TaxID=2025349 RepID=UPI0021B6A705|nr:glycoside hydrolase family protein [Novosphingobium sp. 9]